MAVAAVTAGAFEVNHAHVSVRYREHGRELLAQIMRRLAGGPAGELAFLDFRYAAGRSHGAVRVDGEIIGRAQSSGGLLKRRLGAADVAGDIVLVHLGGADILPQFALLRQTLPAGPIRLKF